MPFEAALHGVECWGFDISPPAVHITSAKIGKRSAAELETTVSKIEDFLGKNEVRLGEKESADSIKFNGVLTSYFHEKTLNEILLARRYFLDNPPINASQSFVLSSLLHILHGNRPYALSRRSHPITPFAPTGDTEYRALMPRLSSKIERSLAKPIPNDFACGHIFFKTPLKGGRFISRS